MTLVHKAPSDIVVRWSSPLAETTASVCGSTVPYDRIALDWERVTCLRCLVLRARGEVAK